jgi:pteridine reductase
MRKAALITGGAKRIGRELSLHLAKGGWDIVITYNKSRDDAAKLKAQIIKLGRKAEILKSDFEDISKSSKLAAGAFKKFKTLSLLINNASLFDRAFISETSPELLKKEFSVNFMAPFMISRQFHKLCPGGNIINILDTRIASNRSTYAAYSLSKKVLAEFTKMAAVEFAPKTRVNGIAPGLILAPSGKHSGYLERLALNIPLQRKGSVDNIKLAVDYIIKNEYVTGQILYCDGGEHLLRLDRA